MGEMLLNPSHRHRLRALVSYNANESLFRNDDTLAIGRQICRNAIEKYYGKDALGRFRKKEEAAREKLSDIYESPVWNQFYSSLDLMIEDHFKSTKEAPPRVVPSLVKETVVFLNKEVYARCPKCGNQFLESTADDGKLLSCPNCFLPIRLRLKENGGEND